MKRIGMVIWVVLIFSFFCGLLGKQAWGASKSKPSSCLGCHANLKSVLPQGHALVTGKDITACLSCHPPNGTDKAQPNPFSTRIHLPHTKSQTKVDCLVCHTWVPGKSFGLIKQKVSWGSPNRENMEQIQKIFQSWSESSFLDALHAKGNVSCEGCHGQKLPAIDDTVENERCVRCHRSYEKLAEKTASPQFPKQNPHKSHLIGMACTKCHSGHSRSQVYCLECHTNFNMKIPGGY